MRLRGRDVSLFVRNNMLLLLIYYTTADEIWVNAFSMSEGVLNSLFTVSILTMNIINFFKLKLWLSRSQPPWYSSALVYCMYFFFLLIMTFSVLLVYSIIIIYTVYYYIHIFDVYIMYTSEIRSYRLHYTYYVPTMFYVYWGL